MPDTHILTRLLFISLILLLADVSFCQTAPIDSLQSSFKRPWLYYEDSRGFEVALPDFWHFEKFPVSGKLTQIWSPSAVESSYEDFKDKIYISITVGDRSEWRETLELAKRNLEMLDSLKADYLSHKLSDAERKTFEENLPRIDSN